MSEPKPFASLSSGLLARKGAARPAMRPQGFGQSGAGLEHLGWNDMGFEAPKPAAAPRDGDHDAFGEDIAEHPRALHKSGLTPVNSPVHGQQAEIADRFSAADIDGAEVDEDFDDTAEPYEAVERPVDDSLKPAATMFKKQPVIFRDAVPDAVVEHIEEEVAAVEPLAAEHSTEPFVPAEQALPLAAQAKLPAPHRTRIQRSAPGQKAKAAFTLRLDQQRHLRLRLACALDGRSAQLIVTEALDRFLESMPELDAMAENSKPKGH